MRALLAVLTLAIPAVAAAKPLPKGTSVTLVKKKLMFTRDGVSVPLVESVLPVDKLKSATLSDDGKNILVSYVSCEGMGMDGEDEPTPIELAKLEARVENTLGMGFHNKKQYGEAIKHFTIAAAKDTDAPVY